MTKDKRVSWLLFIVLSLLWGSSFILIKKGTSSLTGVQVGAIRIFSAGAVFLPLGLIHIGKLPKAKIPIVLLTGLLGNLFPAFLFALAIERKMASSLAGILNSLTPLFVIIIGALFFKANISRRKLGGVLIGFAGLFVLSVAKGPVTVNDIGLTMLVLLATLFYGLNVNVVGHHLKGIDPVKMATVSLSFLTVPTGIILLMQPVSFSSAAVWENVGAIVLLGVLGSALATALFYILIKKAGGLFASLVTYGIPVVAMGWGYFSNEPVGWLQVGCLVVILSGVYLANTNPTP